MSDQRNHKIYTDSMAHSIWDKAFFMDKIGDADAIIDFGCADGAMIRFLAPLFPDKQFYGYDIDLEMIRMAIEKSIPDDDIGFYCDGQLDYMIKVIKASGAKSVCLNLSSVLHEVYSVSGGRDAINQILTELPVNYITIRDMYFHMDSDKFFLVTPPNYFFKHFNPEKITQFEARYGKLDNLKNIVHFMMKYQWVGNGWEEELEENYFSWDIKKFMSDIHWPGSPVFEAHYLLPHLCYRWLKEYEVWLPDVHTHAQFVLAKH